MKELKGIAYFEYGANVLASIKKEEMLIQAIKEFGPCEIKWGTPFVVLNGMVRDIMGIKGEVFLA